MRQDLLPGSIVHFRNRNWVLLPGLPGEEDLIRLRPLTGTSDDEVVTHRRLVEILGDLLPTERILPSEFPWPTADSVADAQGIHLLWQAARLLLREGAVPLRSLGRISFRPRTYQLMPLMIALLLDPVRLLIADDTGTGKTIEAGLIAREFWDRGEIGRLAVLCPPHLCDQWRRELVEKFRLDAVVIGPGTIRALEDCVPSHCSIYERYPVQVISIEFILHPRNRDAFLAHAPELIILDEVQKIVPCPGTDHHPLQGLLGELIRDERRHLILLTATPHDRIARMFRKLTDPEFEKPGFAGLDGNRRAPLTWYFVRRTRKDIVDQWDGASCFPIRQTEERTYALSEAHRKLFDAVYRFCAEIIKRGWSIQQPQRHRRWQIALALLRCVISSPRAARIALECVREGDGMLADEEIAGIGDALRVFDPDGQMTSDRVPVPLIRQAEAELAVTERNMLKDLGKMAEGISGEEDSKLSGCISIVRNLLQEGFQPIVWCHYAETAEYVAEGLRKALTDFPDLLVRCITGRLDGGVQQYLVEDMTGHSGPRVLVTTDCLSEGINLQHLFSAAVHYDLPWNPDQMERREGRVDRYGQPRRVVRAVRYCGKDNPVDDFVIRLSLNRMREICHIGDTSVPALDDDETIIDMLVHSLFATPDHPARQLMLPLDLDPASGTHQKREPDVRREKESRPPLIQCSLRPDDILRELEAADSVLGGPDVVRDFVLSACQKLKIRIRKNNENADVWDIVLPSGYPGDVRPGARRKISSETPKQWVITFTSPPPEGAEYLDRNHPFVTSLAQLLFEHALSGSEKTITARCGVIRTGEVNRLTILLLLRPRYRLLQADRHPLLMEEVIVAGREIHGDRWMDPEESIRLLNARPSENMPADEKRMLVEEALAEVRRLFGEEGSNSPLRDLLLLRVAELEQAHRRIRNNTDRLVRGLRIEPHWPPDFLGILVLQPATGGKG